MGVVIARFSRCVCLCICFLCCVGVGLDCVSLLLAEWGLVVLVWVGDLDVC